MTSCYCWVIEIHIAKLSLVIYCSSGSRGVKSKGRFLTYIYSNSAPFNAIDIWPVLQKQVGGEGNPLTASVKKKPSL